MFVMHCHRFRILVVHVSGNIVKNSITLLLIFSMYLSRTLSSRNNQHRLSVSTAIRVHASHHRINTNPVSPSAPTLKWLPPHSLQHNTTALTLVSATHHSSSGINSFSGSPSLSDSMRCIIYLGLHMRGLRLIIEHVHELALGWNEW